MKWHITQIEKFILEDTEDNGLGPEFYAKGLLQAPDHPNDPTITINSILKYEESEDPTRTSGKRSYKTI